MIRRIKLSACILLILGFTNQQCEENTAHEVFERPEKEASAIRTYLSTADGNSKFEERGIVGQALTEPDHIISIDPTMTYQEIDGFGFTLTGGSAYHINRLPQATRDELLNHLFGLDGDGIGINYLRISLGASDLDAKVFSYNDLPPEVTDVDQVSFSLDPDRQHLIPVLKDIVRINPDIKIMASPWSPPTWMKDNGHSKGGSLLEEYYDSYALYFVKYIEAMRDEGITIDAITIQNEPLHPGNNPSLYMPAAQQADFIKQSLGPVFEEHGIKTKIIIYDHNADRVDYPMSILNDPEANQYVDGSAFHLYGGQIDALSGLHNAHPDKNLYFTEQWIGAPSNFGGDLRWHIRELIIGATRNWCKNVLEWNLAADQNQDPHTDGGCTECLGGLTINGNEVTKNTGYYVIAHASKYVLSGSYRIASSDNSSLRNVAFKRPDGRVVLIVLNDSDQTQNFNISKEGTIVSSSLESGAVATYFWGN